MTLETERFRDRRQRYKQAQRHKCDEKYSDCDSCGPEIGHGQCYPNTQWETHDLDENRAPHCLRVKAAAAVHAACRIE